MGELNLSKNNNKIAGEYIYRLLFSCKVREEGPPHART